mmetsp:Transcript_53122/g.168653  ORF Transcript_53122/g.168653 Transcript_53122/m.168653 type:complete len:264 (+) Transcript_53122:716-1507(+)
MSRKVIKYGIATQCPWSINSCMIAFQLSPVQLRKSRRSPRGKVSKLARELMALLRSAPPKRYIPTIAYTKYTRKRRLPTFPREGRESTKVRRRVRSPRSPRTMRSTRAVRNTRNIRTAEGLTASPPIVLSMINEPNEMTTTSRSKRFQLSRMYWTKPRPVIFRMASMRKMALKTMVMISDTLSKSALESKWSHISAMTLSMMTAMMVTSNHGLEISLNSGKRWDVRMGGTGCLSGFSRSVWRMVCTHCCCPGVSSSTPLSARI